MRDSNEPVRGVKSNFTKRVCQLGAERRDVGLAWRECTRMLFRDSVLS